MSRIAAAGLSLAGVFCCVFVALAQDSGPKWDEILKPAAPMLPKARAKIEWVDDFDKAMALAKKEGRPMFVTLRCLPCKQCSHFDNDVLNGGAELDVLLEQFITVRLTSMRNIDSRILPFEGYQDMDVSWWGYFLSDTAQLYGIYGGMDEVSDRNRVSEKGLVDALKRVLAHHYDKRRAGWGIDREPETAGKPRTPKQLEGWNSWTKHGHREVADSECLHCHQVNEIVRQPLFDKKKFDKARDFHSWPYPENLGLTLGRDTGLIVGKVAKGGAAEAAGIKPGDELGAAGGVRLFSQADLRGVLHRLGGGDKALEVVWLRNGEVHKATLRLKGDWHHSDMGWRKSVAEADIGATHGFPWPLTCNDKERKSRGVEKGKMCVKPFFPDGPSGAAGDAGLKAGDFITAVNGDDRDVSGRAFVVFFKLKFEPGDDVVLTVVGSDGKQREVKYKAPGRKH